MFQGSNEDEASEFDEVLPLPNLNPNPYINASIHAWAMHELGVLDPRRRTNHHPTVSSHQASTQISQQTIVTSHRPPTSSSGNHQVAFQTSQQTTVSHRPPISSSGNHQVAFQQSEWAIISPAGPLRSSAIYPTVEQGTVSQPRMTASNLSRQQQQLQERSIRDRNEQEENSDELQQWEQAALAFVEETERDWDNELIAENQHGLVLAGQQQEQNQEQPQRNTNNRQQRHQAAVALPEQGNRDQVPEAEGQQGFAGERWAQQQEESQEPQRNTRRNANEQQQNPQPNEQRGTNARKPIPDREVIRIPSTEITKEQAGKFLSFYQQ